MRAGLQSSSIKPSAWLHVSLFMFAMHALPLQGEEQTEPVSEPAAVQAQAAEPADTLAPGPLQAARPSGTMEHARDYLSGKITGFASDIPGRRATAATASWSWRRGRICDCR